MCNRICDQYDTLNPEREYQNFLKTKPIINTSKVYENLHGSKRKKCPYLFKGYGMEIDENPMYRTANSEYGFYTPNAYTIPSRNFPLSQKFSNDIFKFGIEIKHLLNSLLWEIYGRIPSTISLRKRKRGLMKMHPRLYEPRLLEKLSTNVLDDICSILQLEIRLMSKYLERVLISRDKNQTHQTILYGFLNVILSSRFEEHRSISLDMSHLFNSIKNLAGSYIQKDSNESTGESSREMRFSLSPPPGSVKGRGDTGRPIITDETNSSSDFNQWLHAMKMVARLPGGMPPEFRRKLWLALAEKYLKSKNVDWEKEEVKCFSEQWREDDEELGIQIVKDLHRTGSSLCSGPAGTINQAKLKRILLGYARYNPEVGYCQGFNMLGALILQVMDKEEIESIKVMIYLVEGILPRGYFSGSLGGLQADMAVFRELMTCKLPRLAKHLQKLQGPVENAFEPPLTNVFTMQWFLTMFCTCLPMTCVLRVWDLVLIEGSDVLLRTALVLWSLLEERILNARTADDFYCKMGSFSSELLNGHLIDSNGLIEKVVDLGPIPELQKLRDKHLYNISPFRDKKGLQLYYSDEEGDSDEDSRMAVATAWGLRLNRRGSAGLTTKTDGKERIALDISLLKKQYDRLRERQRQAHIILTSAVARQGSNSNQASIQMNQLLIGRNAIVTNNGRRLGPPQGAIPPARKPSLPTAKSPKPAPTKSLRRGETLHWRDTELSKRRRGSLKWKDIKSDSSQSGQDERTSQLIESAPSSRSSSSEPKSQRASLKTHQRSDSSSYSEDSDGNSSTSTSLCDEDDHEIGDANVSSLEGSPMKKSKSNKKHSEVPHKKCLEDVLNSNDQPHSVDSQIPFIQLTTMDSPVLNANKTEMDSLEYTKEDSETESNRLDYAGFVDEYSWPDMNEPASSVPFDDITIDVTSDEGEFLSLSNVITSTSQLSPMPDITTYINNSNISPLRTPISAFDYANLVVSIDDSKKFDVNDEGVTNEYFERVNIVERPTKLDLLYSLNEEDSIRNAFKIESCQPSPDPALPKDDSVKEMLSLESSKFLVKENSSKIIAQPSKEDMDRKMKVLLEYSNQSSLSFIAEATHELSSGKFKGKEFDPKSLKYKPSTLVPSNKLPATFIEHATDETTEHIFIVPSTDEVQSLSAKTLKGLKRSKIGEGDDSPMDQSSFATDTNRGFVEKPLNDISEVEQNDLNSFKDFSDVGVGKIPSTADLETRFRALEMSFTDRKGSSLKDKSVKREAKQGSPVCTTPGAHLSTDTTREPCSEIIELPQAPTSSEFSVSSPLTLVHHTDRNNVYDDKEETLLDGDKDHQLTVEQTRDTGGENLSPFLNKQSIKVEKLDSLVQDQTFDMDELQYSPEQDMPKEHKIIEGRDRLSTSENSALTNQATGLEEPRISPTHDVSEGAIGDNSITLLKLENLGQEQSPKRDKPRYLLDEDMSNVRSSDHESEKDSKCYIQTYSLEKSATEENSIKDGSEDHGFTSASETMQATTNTEYSTPLMKDVAEVERHRIKEEESSFDKQSGSINIIEVSMSPLSYSQDHFGDAITLQSQNLFDQPADQATVSDFGSTTHLVMDSKMETSDLKSPLKDHEPDNYSSHRTSDIVSEIQITDAPSLLPYSEDHFGKKHIQNARSEVKVDEQLLDSNSEHSKKFLEKGKALEPSVPKITTHHSDVDPLEEKLISETTNTEESTRQQKSQIPSTQDLESRFMALERQLSEKTLPIGNVVDQSDSKDKVLRNVLTNPDSNVSLETDLKNSNLTKSLTTKPIPSTADLEHRFRELERKLSTTNLKTTPPQQEDLKVPRQSNIITNPSIVVLPNNEETTPSDNVTMSTSHDDQNAIDQPPFIRKRIPSTEDLESRFEAMEIQKTLKSPTAVISNLLSPSKLKTEFISTPESDTCLRRKSDIPSTEDLENRFQALEQSKLTHKTSKEKIEVVSIPSTKDLETRFEALEQRKSIAECSATNKEGKESKSVPSTLDLETRFEALEKRKSVGETSSELQSEEKSKKVPSTPDLERRFEALEQHRSNAGLDEKTSSVLEISREKSKTKDEEDKNVPSTEDLETRYEALEQRKSLTESCSKSRDSQSSAVSRERKDEGDRKLPSTQDLESRFEAFEEQKSISKSKENQIYLDAKGDIAEVEEQHINKPPSTEDLESRFEALEQKKSIKGTRMKSNIIQSNPDSKSSNEITEVMEQDETLEQHKSTCTKLELRERLPSAQDLESEGKDTLKENIVSSNLNICKDDSGANVQAINKLPSTQDLESRFEALEQQKSITKEDPKRNSYDISEMKEQAISKPPSTQDLESRFEALEQQKSIVIKINSDATEVKKQGQQTGYEALEHDKSSAKVFPKTKEQLSDAKCVEGKKQEHENVSKIPSTQDLESRFEALKQQKSITESSSKLKETLETRFEPSEQQKSTTDRSKPKEIHQDSLYSSNLQYKKLSKVPSTHDLEKRFDDMQIDTKKLATSPKKHLNDSRDPTDHHKRKELYKLESQSDETLTATDPTSTEFDAKTESRPTSCPEYSDPFDSNIVTTDRVLKIIEENSKILHRILKKTLADAGDIETNSQSKKSHPGITDSLLALGNIFPHSDETISPSRIKSHSWIRPSITLRSDDNISDRLASIKSTIKSIDTLCEEKSFRKEKCQRYIDSLFARPTITATSPANTLIKVDDFECKSSQDRLAKRELKKDTSPRRRRAEEREEYESRVRRDMMPNSLETPSDVSFNLANIEHVDSEVDRINQEKHVDTQIERPLSPYYVSGYDLNKRSITPVVYIPTKLEIRHTTVTSTFYDRYLTEKHIERTFPRSKKSPVSPTITKSYLDISKYSSSLDANDRNAKSAENSPSRRKDDRLSPNEQVSLTTNKCNLVSTLEVAKKDLHIRSCDNILLQLRTSTTNKDIVPSIMVYNPLPTKIRKPPELGISLGLYKDYGSDESSKS